MNQMNLYDDSIIVYAETQTFQVLGEIDTVNETLDPKSLVEGKGYFDRHDSHVWIYAHRRPDNANQFPYFWFSNGNVMKSRPSAEMYRNFGKDRLVVIDREKIIEESKKNPDVLPNLDQDMINDLNNSSEIFHPVMRVTDDFLKKIIKTVINKLNVRLRTSKYKNKLKKKYGLSNLMSALTSKTKMSAPYFNTWAELFDLKVYIIIESDENAEDKLKEPLIYVRERDAIYPASLVHSEIELPDYLDFHAYKSDDDEEYNEDDE